MIERVAIILAAGEGKRMKSDLPKVLHRLEGKALIRWVLEAVGEAGLTRAIVIVGHGGERVQREVGGGGVEFAWQMEQKGTGHAVMQAEPLLRDFDGSLLVLSGDVPLIQASTIADLLRLHEERDAAATVVTTEMPDPTGYGRIVRTPIGAVERIVEEKDATPEEKKIREINSGTYAFRAGPLFEVLPTIGMENASGEQYLTDTIAALRGRGLPVLPYPLEDLWEVFGINTREHLRLAAEHLGGRSHG